MSQDCKPQGISDWLASLLKCIETHKWICPNWEILDIGWSLFPLNLVLAPWSNNVKQAALSQPPTSLRLFVQKGTSLSLNKAWSKWRRVVWAVIKQPTNQQPSTWSLWSRNYPSATVTLVKLSRIQVLVDPTEECPFSSFQLWRNRDRQRVLSET